MRVWKSDGIYYCDINNEDKNDRNNYAMESDSDNKLQRGINGDGYNGNRK